MRGRNRNTCCAVRKGRFMVVHFKTPKERLDYLKGKHEEIIPEKVEPKKVEAEEPKVSKPKKARKKKDDGKVQAE